MPVPPACRLQYKIAIPLTDRQYSDTGNSAPNRQKALLSWRSADIIRIADFPALHPHRPAALDYKSQIRLPAARAGAHFTH